MPMGLAKKVQSLNQVTGPQAGAGRLCSDLLCDSWTIPDRCWASFFLGEKGKGDIGGGNQMQILWARAAFGLCQW